MSAISTPSLATPLRPLAETAALFRQECFALDHLVEELYRDVEQLRDDLVRKGDEIEDGRKKLAERGRLLAEQRKESGRLVHLLEQQETRLSEALTELKLLREQSTGERQDAKERESARQTFLEQNLRTAEAERDQLRHELHLLQATAAASGASSGQVESLAPLMSELSDMRRQVVETQSQVDDARRQLASAIEHSVSAFQEQSAQAASQTPDYLPQLLSELAQMRQHLDEKAGVVPTPDLMPQLLAELADMRRQVEETQQQLAQTQVQLGDAREQLSAGIDRAALAAEQAAEQAVAPVFVPADSAGADPQTLERLSGLERERIELESELELVRTRATELQEVVTQQRRELVEQRADITTELRLLRELVEQRRHLTEDRELEDDGELVGAATRNESLASAPDPVVSSVMAQFARLQKDVAQRRKKK